jgi:hypothetical protein
MTNFTTTREPTITIANMTTSLTRASGSFCNGFFMDEAILLRNVTREDGSDTDIK